MNLDVSRNFHYKSKLNQTLSNNFNWKGLHLSKKNFFMIRVEIQSPILLKHRQNLREAFKKKIKSVDFFHTWAGGSTPNPHFFKSVDF